MADRMHQDQLEPLIKRYESSWTVQSHSSVHALLHEFKLQGNLNALTELIRIDIELRYEHGHPVCLSDYLEVHHEVNSDPQAVSLIAFEDYRARSHAGLDVAPSRWESVPGIKNEVWFQQLLWDSSTPPVPTESGVLDAEPQFVAALSKAGFHLLHQIGQGSLSRVYLAQQPRLAFRYVVLKVVDREMSEPQHMAMLQHTNIVQIHSFHRILSRSVICMPYAGSVTLADYLRSNREQYGRESSISHHGGKSLIDTVREQIENTDTWILGAKQESDSHRATPVPAAAENVALKPLALIEEFNRNQLATWIFSRLASALAHSHARNVLHGDLKPANVLIQNDGEPALLDFNLSRSLVSNRRTYVGGTLPYMSPESYRDMMRKESIPNRTSDIYSLGVMMFEFVTGRLPFPSPPSEAPTDLESALRARENMHPQWEPGDSVSPSLQSIIMRCLAFDPKDRYQSADDLQDDIECEHENLPLLHASEPRLIYARKWASQNKRWSRFVAICLAGLLLAPAVVTAVSWKNENRRLAASKRFSTFAIESTDTLSMTMLDPNRRIEDTVSAAIEPLQKYELLDQSGLKQFRWPNMSDADRVDQRDTILRHVVQVGFVEASRLTRNAQGKPLTAEQLDTLDQLIASADRVCEDHVSRSLLFLKSKRNSYAGRPEESETQFQTAMAMPLNSDSETYLEAVRLMSISRWTESLDMLSKLAEYSDIPSSLHWTMLGRSQFNARQYEDAKLSITKSIERVPDSSRLWFTRGRIYVFLNSPARAVKDFTRCIELESDFPGAWHARGVANLSQGKVADAIADLTEALRLFPNNATTMLVRSRAYLLADRIEESNRDYDRAINAIDLDHNSYISRAKARKVRGDYEGYVADMKKAYAITSGSRVIPIRIAKTLSMYLGRNEEAIELLNKVLKSYPKDEAALIDRAVLLAYQGRFGEAKRDMETAMVPPNKSLSYYQAACVHALMPNKIEHPYAVQLLAKSLRSGHETTAAKIEDDPDLKSLHDLPGFKAVVRAHRLANAKVRDRESK
ncbi:MAG: tetratricopeptide repeat protein [Rubripirellula sp.]